MIDYENIRKKIAKGLKDYLNILVIKSNQNAELPDYPFVSYLITTLMSENRGTYGVYIDGTKRKMFKQTWSVSAFSDDSSESVFYACKAREWFDEVGKDYLYENGISVVWVGSVTNRDNFISVEYEYQNGFDVTFYLFDEIAVDETQEFVETVEFGINKK